MSDQPITASAKVAAALGPDPINVHTTDGITKMLDAHNAALQALADHIDSLKKPAPNGAKPAAAEPVEPPTVQAEPVA